MTAGSRTPDAPPLDHDLHYERDRSEVLRLLEVVGLVGARPVGITPWVTVTDADRAMIAGTAPAPPYAVLHPGAVDPRRRWPPAAFARVADALAADGLRVVVTGGAGEEALCAEVVARSHAPLCDRGGGLAVGGLAALLEGAAVVVGNDSGPLHLAAAVGAPTVGLYWWPNVTTSAPLERARHRVLISERHACPVCGRDLRADPCGHGVSSVADIGVDEAVAAARGVLERDAPEREPALELGLHRQL